MSVFVIVLSISVFINTVSAERYTLADLISFIVTILSMLLALLAYHISVKTYFSIDAVNAISRMDGNVMENQHYRTGIYSLLRRFNATSREGTCRQIVEYFEGLFQKEKITSGAKLADSIQEMIDLIVLLSFIVNRKDRVDIDGVNDEIARRISSVISDVERRVADFEEMSEGSSVLIRESVKLLKAVFSYQCYWVGEQSDRIGLLLDVRGPMLKNVISRTIYYNYLGLWYMSKAILVLRRHFESETEAFDPFSIDAVSKLREMDGCRNKELAVIYLEEALRNFDCAAEPIPDELMWNGFLQYNIARAQYLSGLLTAEASSNWHQSIQNAINYRSKLVMMLDDICGRDNRSLLQRAFQTELEQAKLMELRLKIATGSVKPVAVNLGELHDDEFHRLSIIYNDIQSHRIEPTERHNFDMDEVTVKVKVP